MHGLTRSLVQNMVTGVTEGYEKKLEIFGTGYLAAVAGNVLQVRVGFAHEVEKPIPAGLTVKCSDAQHVQISGCDKQLVGQFAAEVRAIKRLNLTWAKASSTKAKLFVVRKARLPVRNNNVGKHRLERYCAPNNYRTNQVSLVLGA